MIKAVELGDLENCLSILRIGFESVAEEFGLTSENCPNRGDADLSYETLKGDFLWGYMMFVYVADGKFVGFLSIAKRLELEYVIKHLVVLPEYRHRGYGKALLGHAKAVAAVLSANKLSVNLLNYDARLKNWYMENGFTVVSTDEFSGTPFMTVNMEMEL